LSYDVLLTLFISDTTRVCAFLVKLTPNTPFFNQFTKSLVKPRETMNNLECSSLMLANIGNLFLQCKFCKLKLSKRQTFKQQRKKYYFCSRE